MARGWWVAATWCVLVSCGASDGDAVESGGGTASSAGRGGGAPAGGTSQAGAGPSAGGPGSGGFPGGGLAGSAGAGQGGHAGGGGAAGAAGDGVHGGAQQGGAAQGGAAGQEQAGGDGGGVQGGAQQGGAAQGGAEQGGAAQGGAEQGGAAQGGAPQGGAGGEAPWTQPPLPAGCQRNARVITYNPSGHGKLMAAMAAAPADCADYYIHLPALAGDKTELRGPEAVAGVHAAGPRFHAAAEVHWGGWSQVTTMSWLEKGREVRRRMVEKGYDPARDTWAINELPSSVRSDKSVRADVIELVKGLYEGDGGPPMGGAVFIIGMGSGTENFSVYKPALKEWLSDGAFWKAMNQHVRWWGQEAYAHPQHVCVGSAKVAERSAATNAFAMHVATLASAGPAEAGPARAFFDESYVPLQSAFWHGDPYGTVSTSLENMQHMASTNVYASRAWASSHDHPDWRLALAWNDQLDGATAEQVDALAARVAAAVHDAYAEGDPPAAKACSPSGAYTYCACDVPGAAFNPGWSTFDSW